MTALYITSLHPADGKTTFCAGIASQLKKKGKKVGFFKPVGIAATKEAARAAEKDAAFMKQALALEEPAESLCGLRLTTPELGEMLASQKDGFLPAVQKGFDAVSKGKDIVILEGLSGLEPGGGSASASAKIIKQLKAKAILIAGYRLDLSADKLAGYARSLGQDLLGVVINGVPQGKMEAVRSTLVAKAAEKGVKVLGIIPQDRGLVGPSVAELAEHLKGKILNNPEAADEVVENVMAGALVVDYGPLYLGRKANKAVITHSDRADIQLVALNTSTRCVVITGNKPPIERVLAEAKEKKIPLVQVEQDTLSTIAGVEQAVSQARFNQPKKVAKLEALLSQAFDFKGLFQALGA